MPAWLSPELIAIAVLAMLIVNIFLCLLLLLRHPKAGGPEKNLSEVIAVVREEMTNAARSAREEFSSQLETSRGAAETHAKSLREELMGSFDKLSKGITLRLDGFTQSLSDHRKAASEEARALREEVGNTLSALRTSITEGIETSSRNQVEKLEAVVASVKGLMDSNEKRHDALRQTVEEKLDKVRGENAEKLEQMRLTVDEKLQGTLEQRLGASFNQVNENLERVFKSVGEMQSLATGVGDLKRVLSNVKARGTWGETNLGMLLEQVLATEQYAENVEVVPNTGQRVEYAVKLPGDEDVPIWLPIDAKVPLGDYEKLAEASERGDAVGVEEAAKAFERAIRLCGRTICEKYINPPHSTDFAVMFLPTEGLFAEVVRRPGLVDSLQRDCRVVVAGPTTLMALLVSLRMGFRSLAIQERSSEVWRVLGAVKTEFQKFGNVLDKVEKKLGEAQKTVEAAGVRRRAVDRQLKAVEALPEAATKDVMAKVAEEFAEEIEHIDISLDP